MGRKKFTKSEMSWILYDAANSAFIMILAATIPIYFRELAQREGMLEHATSLWGTVTSISVLILAVLSPFIGAVADYKNVKKKIFAFFLILAIAGAIGFTFSGSWIFFLIFILISRLGYNACNMLYDSMLIDVTEDERMDKVSSWGYSIGYIGSCIPFIAGLYFVLKQPFNLSLERSMQISFGITIVWWALLSIPLFKNVKQTHYLDNTENVIKQSLERLSKTIKKILENRQMFYYIISYFLFIDGVYTIISMSTIYGSEIGIDSTNLVLALLVTQFVAFPCAILAAKIAEKIGTITVIKIFIVVYIFICYWGYRMNSAFEFWILAILVGMCQGGIQALSRSHFGKLVPKDEASEYFGFFDIFGKFADFFGPLIVSAASLLFKSTRLGILFLAVLFLLGLILLTVSERNKLWTGKI